MTYKFKSLIYFCCFVIASVIYYVVDRHDAFEEQLNSKNYAEVEYMDAEDLQAQKKGIGRKEKVIPGHPAPGVHQGPFPFYPVQGPKPHFILFSSPSFAVQWSDLGPLGTVPPKGASKEMAANGTV